jgi:hypothetical protein
MISWNSGYKLSGLDPEATAMALRERAGELFLSYIPRVEASGSFSDRSDTDTD